MQVPAMRIVQEGVTPGSAVTIYVTAMTLEQMRSHVKVDQWSPSNPSGYQRPLVERRLREVAKYVLEEQGVFPTSILVGTRPQDQPRITASGFKEGEAVSLGTLDLPEGSILWVVDGQHRFFSVDYSYERGAE